MLDKGPGHLLKADILTDYLQEIEEKVQYKHWFFGHYHMDQEVDEKHSLLYHALVLLEEPGHLDKTPVLGSPRYHREDIVRIKWDETEKIGKVFTVDAFGTFEQREEPSYDIFVEEGHCLYKHICEADVLGKVIK